MHNSLLVPVNRFGRLHVQAGDSVPGPRKRLERLSTWTVETSRDYLVALSAKVGGRLLEFDPIFVRQGTSLCDRSRSEIFNSHAAAPAYNHHPSTLRTPDWCLKAASQGHLPWTRRGLAMLLLLYIDSCGSFRKLSCTMAGNLVVRGQSRIQDNLHVRGQVN